MIRTTKSLGIHPIGATALIDRATPPRVDDTRRRADVLDADVLHDDVVRHQHFVHRRRSVRYGRTRRERSSIHFDRRSKSGDS
jgi:hypothetical protein